MSTTPGAFGRFSVPPLDNTLGAMLIGVLFSAALWGISCAQAYHYYTIQRYMASSNKCFRFFALISHAVYTYLITWYNDPLNLLRIVWSSEVQVLVTAVNALIVQGFFTWRVWHLGGKSILRVSPLAVLTLASFSTEILYYTEMKRCGSICETSKLLDYAYILAAVGVANIVAITVPTTYLLHSSRSGFATTNNIIQRLIVFGITTGTVTSICAIMSLVTKMALPKTLIAAAFYILLSKLATNSLLMTLNMRGGIRAALPNTVAIGSLHFAPAANQVTGARLAMRYSSAGAATVIVTNHHLAEQCGTAFNMSSTPHAAGPEYMA